MKLTKKYDFFSIQSKTNKYQNVINKAVDYVVRNLEGNDDLYALALASYALQLAKHNSKNYILQTFDAQAIRKGIFQFVVLMHRTSFFIFFLSKITNNGGRDQYLNKIQRIFGILSQIL